MLNRGFQAGAAHTAIIATLATVAVSVGAFFLFTLPATKKKPDTADTGADEPAAPEIADPDPTPDPPAPEPEPEPEPEPAPVDFRNSPASLLGEIAKRLRDADVAGAHELIGADVGGGREGLAAAFGPTGYTPAPDKGPSEVGLIGDVTRWVMPVVRRQNAEIPDADSEPVIDGVETEGGARVFFDLVTELREGGLQGWAVRDIHYPEGARALAASAAPEKLSPQAQGEKDALVMADGFITAVTGRNFSKALQDCTEEVPEEKIAGLCIVFEEGEFKLREQKPLVATALGEDTAWVIAHVESAKLGAGTEFGLEMKRRQPAAGDPAPAADPAAAADAKKPDWEIVGINFGKLLDTYVAASEAGRVPYTPIKSDPGSGEKLVLYFEYDAAELLPRAKRQLEIIGNILKADAEETLTIAGHSDSLGSEDYNVALSAARAASVKAQLIANGVPDTQVVAEGFGEAKPWKAELRDDGTDDPRGRSYNRRAEIYLRF